jgi:cell division transport system permease protein
MLAAAAGLAIERTTASMRGALAGRITVQIVEANPDLRTRQRADVARELRRLASVSAVTEVSDAEVRDLLTPWLGAEGLDSDIPVPALIDATLSDSSAPAIAVVGDCLGRADRGRRSSGGDPGIAGGAGSASCHH